VKAWLALLVALGGCAGIASKGTSGQGGQGGVPAVGDAASDSPRDAGGLDLGSLTDVACDGAPETCRPNPCGNSMLNPPAETCDDSNHTGGDGCSPDCKTETDWICPTPGSACIYTVACGDGMIAGAESCDDHNTKAGDGCSATCQLEPGWTCPQQGARCVPRCGDGTKLGFEQCDDGNASPGDGCSDSCRVEPGFACPTAGDGCVETDCGDGDEEGSEQHRMAKFGVAQRLGIVVDAVEGVEIGGDQREVVNTGIERPEDGKEDN